MWGFILLILMERRGHQIPVATGTVQRIRNLFEDSLPINTPQRKLEPGALEYNREEILSFPRSSLMEMALHYRKLCEQTREKELFICTDILKIAPSAGDPETSFDLSLDEIRGLPGNETCADCNSQDTSWASTNLGVFLCIRCSGVHRSIGVHVTQILSCTLDIWTSDLVKNMEKRGNKIVNEEYEHHILQQNLKRVKLTPDSSMQERQLFIKAKYISKQFHKSCKEAKYQTYALRRTKLMKSRIMSTSQTNLRTDLLSPYVPPNKSNSSKGMIQYCGIVFISVDSFSQGKSKKRKAQTVKTLRGTIAPSFVSFSLDKQVEYYKEWDKSKRAPIKLNLPMEDRKLTVALHRRSRLKQGDTIISQVMYDLYDEKFKEGSSQRSFVFPDSKVSIGFTVTIELLG